MRSSLDAGHRERAFNRYPCGRGPASQSQSACGRAATCRSSHGSLHATRGTSHSVIYHLAHVEMKQAANDAETPSDVVLHHRNISPGEAPSRPYRNETSPRLLTRSRSPGRSTARIPPHDTPSQAHRTETPMRREKTSPGSPRAMRRLGAGTSVPHHPSLTQPVRRVTSH